ncbi:MAG: hypothetical protein M1831_005262 [Alyxoria varia]|nr:MAG: hypothetical protein M1831_005262 [Alyxoria varia]
MSPRQRYERISLNDNDHDDYDTHSHVSSDRSSPPSFRSRASSTVTGSHRHQNTESEHLVSDAERTLADTFDSPSDDESDDESSNQLDDRQRAMSGRPLGTTSGAQSPTHQQNGQRPAIERRVTQLPVFAPPNSNRVYGGGNAVHDGVFANLNAKPERGEEVDEKPPTYEQAAADATPPYWETTILTPHSTSDDVFIDGLPVGSFFSFIWNAMISMSFNVVGFLLTYLLHTTHAAKNGSKAGLGITMIQYGFSLKRSMASVGGGDDKVSPPPPGGGDGSGKDFVQPPSDPNSHDFDPGKAGASPLGGDAGGTPGDDGGAAGGMQATDWFAYALMLVGWFILIRAVSEYFKARRHENLVLQSPSRGLNIPVVADNERPENSV